MKLTLMIEGSAAVIAAVLAALPNDATATVGGAPAPMPMPSNTGDEDDGEGGSVVAIDGAVDSTGLPWDARIHSAAKTQSTKGVWRRQKGVDDATFNAVTAELRARSGQPAPTPQPAPMPAPVMPQAPVPMPTPPAPAPMPAPVAPQPAPVMPAPPPMMPAPAPAPMPAPPAPPQPAGAMDFSQFMQHLQGQMQKPGADGQPLVNATYLASLTQEIATAFGQPLTTLTDIHPNPQMITFAMQAMQRDQRW